MNPGILLGADHMPQSDDGIPKAVDPRSDKLEQNNSPSLKTLDILQSSS
jgi:hypothetical protein